MLPFPVILSLMIAGTLLGGIILFLILRAYWLPDDLHALKVATRDHPESLRVGALIPFRFLYSDSPEVIYALDTAGAVYLIRKGVSRRLSGRDQELATRFATQAMALVTAPEGSKKAITVAEAVRRTAETQNQIILGLDGLSNDLSMKPTAMA